MSLTLRDLPLPVKVVASVFLMAVGVGYSSAMVQLHLQDSKSGQPMPTVEDVIRKYTGKKKFDPNAPTQAPVSRLEALVTNPTVAISGASMSGAFTTGDRAPGELKFNKAIQGKTPEQVVEIKAQRVGEQIAVALWINAPEDQRKAAYTADRFTPAGEMPKTMTPAFLDGTAIKIKSIIDARCVSCHAKGGEKEDVPLNTYDGLAKFMKVEAAPASGEWVKVEEPISVTKLTQSTHAHLLSFAVLFSLTGLVFACSSYPVWVRCVLGPWVVLAVVADVSLWWLARLSDEWGPYFAMGIIGTGGLAGLGLAGQITLSLFNMYGRKGKVVIAGLFLLGGALAGLVIVTKIKPELDIKLNPPKPETPHPVSANGHAKKDPEPPTVDPKPAPKFEPTALEKLLAFPVKGPDGKVLSMEETPFTGGDDGNMARAFFDKEKVYRNVMNDDAVSKEKKDKLHVDRDGERLALIAWIRAADPDRKSAFETDSFVPPPDLKGKSISAEYLKGDTVLVKTIITDRCLRCHGPDGKQFDEYPLDTYEKLQKYLISSGAAVPLTIPPAKDD
jgi:cytochrome c553